MVCMPGTRRSGLQVTAFAQFQSVSVLVRCDEDKGI